LNGRWRVVVEILHLLGHGDHGFLNDVLRFGIREAGLEGDAIDQVPVGVEELRQPPDRPSSSAGQEAPPRGDQRVAVLGHGLLLPRLYTAANSPFLQESTRRLNP